MRSEILTLIKKDLLLEFRQRFAFFSIILYILSTVYVCYLVFQRIDDPLVWNALFWVIMTFTAVGTAGKSFQQESGSRFYFYYQIARPEAMILSKIIYNQMLMAVLGGFTWLIFSLLLGDLIEDKWFFGLVVLLGSIGFGAILTTLSGIASKTNQNTTLLAVLSIPLMLPFLVILVRGSLIGMMGGSMDDLMPYLIGLLLLNAIVISLGFLLFPYLWRE
jgi:heme exporter protein B